MLTKGESLGTVEHFGTLQETLSIKVYSRVFVEED